MAASGPEHFNPAGFELTVVRPDKGHPLDQPGRPTGAGSSDQHGRS